MPGLDGLLAKLRREGREDVSWGTMAAILGVARFCEPSSELHIEQKWCRRTALEDLLGVPPEKVPADRLYAALDRLLPHKEAIESRLTQRFGELFELKCDLLLYDVTSTCFEGTPKAMLRQFERHLTDQDWVVAQEGVDVKLVPSPDGRRHFFSRGASIGAPRNRRCTRSSSATCRRA